MLSDFYTVENWQAEKNKATANISYNAEHNIFSGHFPNQPVVPGVCTMDMMKQLLQRATGNKLLLSEAAQVKFLRLILPDAKPEVLVQWEAVENGWKIIAGLKENGADLFKMSARFMVIAD